jgi:anti-sigma B factor antagonist
MIFSIRELDFYEHDLAIQIESGPGEDLGEQLSAFAAICNSLGYKKMTIYNPDASEQIRKALSGLESPGSIDIVVEDGIHSVDTHRDSGNFSFQFRNLNAHNKEVTFPNFTYEYQINLNDIQHLVSFINDFTILTGHSLLLDEMTLNNLRLCIYELAMNTLEHGSFKKATPSVSLCYVTSDTRIKITYMDNGEPFITAHKAPVDINRNIEESRKRGLGLYILNRISEDLTYRRYGKWNVTRFTLKRYDESPLFSVRRIGMADFSTEVRATDKADTAVLKPSGTVDSSATESLETRLNELLEQGKKMIVIDFSDVEFISSAGIGLLLGTVSNLREEGGDLIFMNVPQQIKKIFDIINVSPYFREIKSLDELRDLNKTT